MTAQALWAWQEPRAIGEWRNFTDMKNVTAVAAAPGAIWAATSGGVFVRHAASATVSMLTNSEGLSSNDVTAIAADGARIWVGHRDGTVDALSPNGARERTIGDIKATLRTQKRIRRFLVEGDTLFIATDFGVSVYRLSRSEFGDTYANFGFVGQAGVNDLLVRDGKLWVATDLGVARAPRFATNLSAPTSWTRYQTASGLPGLVVFSLEVLNDTLLAGTSQGAAFFDGAGFQSLPAFAGRQVVRLAVASPDLYAVSNQSGIFRLHRSAFAAADPVTVAGDFGVASDLALTSSGPWIGTNARGIVSWDGAAWISVFPNGPQSNLFSGLAVDPDGVLWCASGISGQGRGFYRYNPSLPAGEQWKNFTVAAYPVMGSNDYFKIAAGAGGSVWASSWGEGVVEIRGDSIVRKLDTESSPSFATSDNADPSFPVVNGVAVDPGGRTWFANWGARNRNFLVRLTSDTTFTYFTHPIISSGLFTAMAIDVYGTKWLANAEPFHPSKGLYLYYFNEDERVSGTSSTGGWGFMTTSDGLPHNTILSVAVDLRGSVCVGTELGFMIISDPLFPKQRRFTSFPLREQVIQAIAIDAVNNKWVGTKEGLFVMNADATQILEQYTTANTGGRLVDNDIRSLAIDQQRGVVYIGTERGLSSLSIAPVAASRTLTELRIGPNPFVIPSDRQLEIRNLAPETSIKILTLNGSLVSEFGAQGGGRAFWNGRDRQGNLVPSGVYFVVAFVENGDEVAAGKVAVVRK